SKYMKEIGRCGRRAVAGELWPQTGLAYLAATVREARHIPLIIDAMAEELTLKQLIQRVTSWKPEMIVVNTTTPTFNNDIAIITEIKKVIPAKIVLVGTHPSALPRETASISTVDFVLINEAEETIVELADFLSVGKNTDEHLQNIRGLAFKDKTGEVVITPPRPFIEPLDKLPFPARDLLPNHRYYMPFFGRLPFATVIPTRGCPWQCIFCRAGTVWGKKIRTRNPSNVADEIQYIIDELRIRHIVFMTDSLTLNKNWLMEFLEIILARNLKFKWICNSRVDAVDLEMLKLMKRSGCKLISYGVESGSQEILDLAKKHISINDSRRAISMTRAAGILSMAYFIFGLPGENRQTIQQTIDFIKELNPDYINVHIATPFPGTEFYKIAQQNNWLTSLDWSDYEEEGSAVVRTAELTTADLIQAQKRAMREFYLRPRWLLRELFRFRNHTSLSSRLSAAGNVLRTLFNK
ncbi:MAG: B12-binding domain-containing radical SAM protein, partial [Candidatus Sumerlaeia bacterium]|nr:B12-binding domain-containing radical SAM protein [Candidatus Sumerlaeia bacterium]